MLTTLLWTFFSYLVEVIVVAEVVLQGHWAPQRASDVDFFALGTPNPVGEVKNVGHSSRQQHQINVLREHDDHLLPHYPALRVVDVMHLAHPQARRGILNARAGSLVQ
eukprot:1182514-Prorocentrum_minimum.AAC.2